MVESICGADMGELAFIEATSFSKASSFYMASSFDEATLASRGRYHMNIVKWYSFLFDFLNVKTKYGQNVFKSLISEKYPDFPPKMSGN